MSNELGSTDNLHLDRVVALTVAYVSGNMVRADQLGEIISSFSTAIRALDNPVQEEVIPAEPKVSIKKSITPDYIICLDDGQKYKSLKRHLAKLGMTPDEYRARWGLPNDYPMVAPNYAEARSALAKAAGLGRKRSEPVVKTPETAETEVVAETPSAAAEEVHETPAPKAPRSKAKKAEAETETTEA